MRLNLGRAWTDAGAMLRADIDALTAIAGMFILVPSMIFSWILPDRAPPPAGSTLTDLLNSNADYMSANWPIVLLNALLVAFGSLTLLALLLHPSRPTVAQAMRISLIALPFYMVASLLQTALVMTGLLLFIIPGVYLIARLLCVAPVAAAEGRVSPIAMLVRSFKLTTGNGWRIVLLAVVILFVSLIVSMVLSLIFGIASTLLLPPDLARLAHIVIGTLIQTLLAVAVTLVSAAVYRQVAAPVHAWRG